MSQPHVSPAQELALQELRNALRGHAEQYDRGEVRDALRRAATHLCADAHLRALRPESMLVEMKLAWPSLVAESTVSRADAVGLLEDAITIAIDHYYASPRDD
jgi:hypothetical protein